MSEVKTKVDTRTEEEKEMDRKMEEGVHQEMVKKHGPNYTSLGFEDAESTGIQIVKDRDTYVDRNNLKAGSYHMKNGKLVKGSAEPRMAALYSNWHGANSDPDDLEKY